MIYVGAGVLGEVGRKLREVSGAAKVMVVTDSVVGPLYLGRLGESLRGAGFEVVEAVLPAGEKHKHLGTLLPVYERLLGANVDRGTPLVALGGGVVGDMAGFVAATLLRGVLFVQVPTTLMAMVDSSIGGKTGVNQSGESGGKNLIGAFHQPRLVIADVELLKSLPEGEVSNGLAECIKHDAIADRGHLGRWGELMPRVFAREVGALGELVHHNASIKAGVVAQDPTEQGVRAHLNFGHTFAHAFEAVSHHGIAHGEAVGLGLVAAAHLSEAMGMLSAGEREELIGAVRLARLPTVFPAGHRRALMDTGAVLAAMQRDKKTEGGHLRFVLLEGLGKAMVHKGVPVGEVVRVLGRLGVPS